MIKLVPIMKLAEDGKSLEKFSTNRTFKKGIKSVIDDLQANNIDDSYKICIAHACKEDLAKEAKELIEKSMQGVEVEIILLTPAFTTQGGPGCIAIQTIKKHQLME